MVRLGYLCLRILASRKFFIFTVVLLILQALWIAISFNYPLLWDEYYHFGLIQFYAHHLSPIIISQPESLDLYGNVARSPKYFYHYLLSFPFRGIELITSNQTAQVILLRIINIGIFAGALVAFKKAMLLMTPSKALVNFALFIFVLFPLTPLMAAHINYDTLQFLFAGSVLYWALRFIKAEQFEIRWLLLIIGFGSMAAIVKYTFLPVLAVVGLYLIGYIMYKHGRNTFALALVSWQDLSRRSMIALAALVLIGAGLAVERFGGNLVQYGRVDPVCSQVISVERCLSFSPFKQEHTLGKSQGTESAAPTNLVGPLQYSYTYWLRDIYKQYFTTGTQLAYEVFIVPEPFKIPFTVMAVAGIIGLVCFLIASPKLLRRPDVQIVLLSAFVLALSLWIIDYEKYVRTGAPLAIQGRYLLPLFPMVMLVCLIAVNNVLPWERLKVALGGIVVAGMIWGGGLLPHIVQSNQEWYWQNRLIVNTNNAITELLDPALL